MRKYLLLIAMVAIIFSCKESTNGVDDSVVTKTEQQQKQDTTYIQDFSPANELLMDILFVKADKTPLFSDAGWKAGQIKVYYEIDGKKTLVNTSTTHSVTDNPNNFIKIDGNWCRLFSNDQEFSTEFNNTYLEFPDNSVDTVRCQVKAHAGNTTYYDIAKIWYNGTLKYDSSDKSITPTTFSDGSTFDSARGIVFEVVK